MGQDERSYPKRGYGATECSPVIACNRLQLNRLGSVRPLLPGIAAALDRVPGIEIGDKLKVRGANVMAGYMLADAPGVIRPPDGGCHDTGDIVALHQARVVSIKGRAKQFAKIGSEMVSLAALVALAAGLRPEAQHVVIYLPDERKGRQLLLVTDEADADRAQLLAHAQAEGFA